MSEADAAAGRSSALKSENEKAMDGSEASTSRMTEPSKRQRRLQQQYKNSNGSWEQPQPRIKSLEQRETAHLRASGLVDASSTSNRQGGTVVTNTAGASKIFDEGDDNSDITSHFARKLGSADSRVRHQTVRMLKAYLKVRSDCSNANGGFTELDLSKLWKCLWYTLYLCDRAPVQDELCQQLGSLVWSFAGSLEQDEEIAQAYLDSTNEFGFMDDEDSSNDNDDESDDDVILEEIENTLEDENMDDDEGASSESSELDFEAKQLAMLQEEEFDDEGSSSEESNDLDFEAKQLAILEEEELDDEGINGEADDDDDDAASLESSELDFEAKQLAILQEDEPDDERFERDADSEFDDDEEEDFMENNIENGNDSDIDPSDIRHCQGAHLAALFVRVFWSTCLREWGKLDKYRVDKFYTCLRYMLAATYDYMASRHWSLGIIRLFNDALYEEVLSKTPNGVRYHIVDCCLEELCRASSRSGGLPLTEATLIDVLEPYFALAQTGDGDDTLQARVTEQVLIKFLTQYSVYNENFVARRKDAKVGTKQTDEKSNGSLKDIILDKVHVGTFSKFVFEVAADDAVAKDEYRQSLYNVHKQYERVIRQVGSEYDVDLEEGNEMEDEVEYSGNDNEIVTEPRDEDLGIQEGCLEKVNEIVQNSIQTDEFVAEKKSEYPSEAKKVHQLENNSGIVSTDSENASASGPGTKKRKKRKKKKKDTDTAEAPSLYKEEVVIISKADQTAAKMALKEKLQASSSLQIGENKKRHSDVLRSGKEEVGESLKRVKFGDNNRARSWKASMQGLQGLKIKPILQKSPERSILLNKGAATTTAKPQGKGRLNATRRKKAKDYF